MDMPAASEAAKVERDTALLRGLLEDAREAAERVRRGAPLFRFGSEAIVVAMEHLLGTVRRLKLRLDRLERQWNEQYI